MVDTPKPLPIGSMNAIRLPSGEKRGCPSAPSGAWMARSVVGTVRHELLVVPAMRNIAKLPASSFLSDDVPEKTKREGLPALASHVSVVSAAAKIVRRR